MNHDAPRDRPHGDPGTQNHLLEARTENTRAAIASALGVLDPQQRERAMAILDEHGAADPSRGLPPPGRGPRDRRPPTGRPPGGPPMRDADKAPEP